MDSESAKDRLASIEAGALDPTTDITTVLRHCLALGAETGSERLREWASRELKGYGFDNELPAYRVTHALLFMDGFAGAGRFSRQQVSATLIPDVAHDLPDRDIELREPLAELVKHVEDARAEGDAAVLVVPPGVTSLVPLMNHRLSELNATTPGARPRQMIDRVYWAVPFATFTGITDSVRTILVELVAEIRAGLPAGVGLPSRELTDQAFRVVVQGDNNSVVLSHAGPGGTAVSAGKTVTVGGVPESRAKTVAWWIFGILASAGAIAGIIAMVHH